MEKMHIENGIKDSIYVISTLLDNEIKPSIHDSNKYFPFNDLYNKDYIRKSKFPRKPIMVSRNSHSITFKLPPFFPEIDENTCLKNPNKLKLDSY